MLTAAGACCTPAARRYAAYGSKLALLYRLVFLVGKGRTKRSKTRGLGQQLPSMCPNTTNCQCQWGAIGSDCLPVNDSSTLVALARPAALCLT